MADFPMHAYLSYRCTIHRDIEARDKLAGLCSAHGITLKYDKVETKEGDSLIKFMDDLSSARFVCLFLSPEYFQSAYTLYELVKINEWAELDQRFILPLKVTVEMVTYQWTSAKQFFEQNEAVRNELKRLLKTEGQTCAALWQRIDDAWRKLVFPNLDELHTPLGSYDDEKKLTEYILQTKTGINDSIKQATDTLKYTVEKNIATVLNRNQLNSERFREELELTGDFKGETIAHRLTEYEVGEAIALLTRVVEAEKSLMDSNSYNWKACFQDAEQICGWLLLNSIEPTWWFHNELGLRKGAEAGLDGRLVLDDRAYVEVVISRSLLQRASYVLNERNKPKPGGEKFNALLFDGTSRGATEQMLRDVYRDLFRSLPDDLSNQDLLESIVWRAKTISKTYHGKPIYYLVPHEMLDHFTECFMPVRERLRGHLQFICCDQSSGSLKGNACKENQTELLDQVANLISLSNGD